jgi:hypothetical protein
MQLTQQQEPDRQQQQRCQDVEGARQSAHQMVRREQQCTSHREDRDREESRRP